MDSVKPAAMADMSAACVFGASSVPGAEDWGVEEDGVVHSSSDTSPSAHVAPVMLATVSYKFEGTTQKRERA